MSKGDAGHAAQHQHGVQERKEPPAPLTVEQRLAAVEARIAKLEKGIPAPSEVFAALDTIEAAVGKVEPKAE